MSSKQELQKQEVDLSKGHYPFCIVWTPLPILSWLVPYVGHMGITTSNGEIRDFYAPYHVSKGNHLTYGKPVKYWRLDPNLAEGGIEGWDRGIEEASALFCTRMHYLFWSNCHSHVSSALNHMKYNGRTDYSRHKMFFLVNFHSRYVSLWGRIKAWLPFTILVTSCIIAYYKLTS